MSEPQSLKEEIMQGPILYGIALLTKSPVVAEVTGLSEADFAWIEMEHSAIDLSQLVGMCRALDLQDTLSLARVPDGSRPSVLRTLEAGARIVLVPQVHTPQQAARVAEYGKFMPIGNRGYNLGSRGLGYGTLAETPNEMMAAANNRTVLMVQIESVQALQNAREIIDTDGIDGIFYGPGDMSADMGIPSQWDNERLLSAGEEVMKLACDLNKIASSTCATVEMAGRWKQAGAHMLVTGGEIGLLKSAISDCIAQIKQA